MLGSSLVPVLDNHDHSVIPTDIRFTEGRMKRLDVRNLDEMLKMARSAKPDAIVHLAAETDLEECETKIEYAYQENYIGTQNACVACRELSIPLTYVSTAGVFDGTKTEPYTEFDTPNPINVYGDSKFRGEQIVRETVPDHFIVRAGWMIGGGERDKKFVSKIFRQLDAGAKELFAVTDRKGTPTYAPAFSVVLEKIIATKFYGTYHLACKGTATRYDVAAEMLKILGRTDVELHPVQSEFFKNEFFAPRPLSEEMRNFVLDLRSMNDMPDWRTALDEYLKTYFPHEFK